MQYVWLEKLESSAYYASQKNTLPLPTHNFLTLVYK